MASPLTNALQKAAPAQVRWGPNELRVFEQLHNSLQGEPVLRNPDFAQPFIVHTDASAMGLGATLSQEIDGQDRPILFIHRKLQPTEKYYSTVEKEALAVKWAVGALQYYLTVLSSSW